VTHIVTEKKGIKPIASKLLNVRISLLECARNHFPREKLHISIGEF
jgi:hypothetical protein